MGYFICFLAGMFVGAVLMVIWALNNAKNDE